MKNLLLTLTLLTATAPVIAGLFEHDEDETRVLHRPRHHFLHGGKSKSERRADREERVEQVREERRAQGQPRRTGYHRRHRKVVTTTYE